jgi:hypothetical protein
MTLSPMLNSIKDYSLAATAWHVEIKSIQGTAPQRALNIDKGV